MAHSNRDPALRASVAIASRILNAEGILDYSGHVSVRAPGREAYFIQAGSDPRSELEPDRLLLVDFDGRVVEGDGKPPIEAAIHGEIYRQRADVEAVLHSHMELAIAFTLMQDAQLKPMRARAVRWASGIPTHPDPSHIKLPEQGRALAQTLGPHQAALIRAHGLVLVAESIPALLVDAVHFEENAKAQIQVMQAGQVPVPLNEAEMEQINRHEVRDYHCSKLWTYYLSRARKSGLVPDHPSFEV